MQGFGHHTKDNHAILQLISNLFKVMGSRNQEYMMPQMQRLCMRIIFNILKPYNKNEDIIELFTTLLKADENIRDDDMALSVMVNSFIKPFMVESADGANEDDPYIVFVIDEVFPRTLDVLMDDAPHIDHMAQRIQSSLNLYINMRSKYKSNEKVKKLETDFYKRYMDSMLKVI